jgi:hypothetical protein
MGRVAREVVVQEIDEGEVPRESKEVEYRKVEGSKSSVRRSESGQTKIDEILSRPAVVTSRFER